MDRSMPAVRFHTSEDQNKTKANIRQLTKGHDALKPIKARSDIESNMHRIRVEAAPTATTELNAHQEMTIMFKAGPMQLPNKSTQFKMARAENKTNLKTKQTK